MKKMLDNKISHKLKVTYTVQKHKYIPYNMYLYILSVYVLIYVYIRWDLGQANSR